MEPPNLFNLKAIYFQSYETESAIYLNIQNDEKDLFYNFLDEDKKYLVLKSLKVISKTGNIDPELLKTFTLDPLNNSQLWSDQAIPFRIKGFKKEFPLNIKISIEELLRIHFECLPDTKICFGGSSLFNYIPHDFVLSSLKKFFFQNNLDDSFLNELDSNPYLQGLHNDTSNDKDYFVIPPKPRAYNSLQLVNKVHQYLLSNLEEKLIDIELAENYLNHPLKKERRGFAVKRSDSKTLLSELLKAEAYCKYEDPTKLEGDNFFKKYCYIRSLTNREEDEPIIVELFYYGGDFENERYGIFSGQSLFVTLKNSFNGQNEPFTLESAICHPMQALMDNITLLISSVDLPFASSKETLKFFSEITFLKRHFEEGITNKLLKLLFDVYASEGRKDESLPLFIIRMISHQIKIHHHNDYNQFVIWLLNFSFFLYLYDEKKIELIEKLWDNAIFQIKNKKIYLKKKEEIVWLDYIINAIVKKEIKFNELLAVLNLSCYFRVNCETINKPKSNHSLHLTQTDIPHLGISPIYQLRIYNENKKVYALTIPQQTLQSIKQLTETQSTHIFKLITLFDITLVFKPETSPLRNFYYHASLQNDEVKKNIEPLFEQKQPNKYAMAFYLASAQIAQNEIENESLIWEFINYILNNDKSNKLNENVIEIIHSMLINWFKVDDLILLESGNPFTVLTFLVQKSPTTKLFNRYITYFLKACKRPLDFTTEVYELFRNSHAEYAEKWVIYCMKNKGDFALVFPLVTQQILTLKHLNEEKKRNSVDLYLRWIIENFTSGPLNIANLSEQNTIYLAKIFENYFFTQNRSFNLFKFFTYFLLSIKQIDLLKKNLAHESFDLFFQTLTIEQIDQWIDFCLANLIFLKEGVAFKAKLLKAKTNLLNPKFANRDKLTIEHFFSVTINALREDNNSECIVDFFILLETHKKILLETKLDELLLILEDFFERNCTQFEKNLTLLPFVKKTLSLIGEILIETKNVDLIIWKRIFLWFVDYATVLDLEKFFCENIFVYLEQSLPNILIEFAISDRFLSLLLKSNLIVNLQKILNQEFNLATYSKEEFLLRIHRVYKKLENENRLYLSKEVIKSAIMFFLEGKKYDHLLVYSNYKLFKELEFTILVIDIIKSYLMQNMYVSYFILPNNLCLFVKRIILDHSFDLEGSANDKIVHFVFYLSFFLTTESVNLILNLIFSYKLNHNTLINKVFNKLSEFLFHNNVKNTCLSTTCIKLLTIFFDHRLFFHYLKNNVDKIDDNLQILMLEHTNNNLKDIDKLKAWDLALTNFETIKSTLLLKDVSDGNFFYRGIPEKEIYAKAVIICVNTLSSTLDSDLALKILTNLKIYKTCRTVFIEDKNLSYLFNLKIAQLALISLDKEYFSLFMHFFSINYDNSNKYEKEIVKCFEICFRLLDKSNTKISISRKRKLKNYVITNLIKNHAVVSKANPLEKIIDKNFKILFDEIDYKSDLFNHVFLCFIYYYQTSDGVSFNNIELEKIISNIIKETNSIDILLFVLVIINLKRQEKCLFSFSKAQIFQWTCAISVKQKIINSQKNIFHPLLSIIRPIANYYSMCILMLLLSPSRERRKFFYNFFYTNLNSSSKSIFLLRLLLNTRMVHHHLSQEQIYLLKDQVSIHNNYLLKTTTNDIKYVKNFVDTVFFLTTFIIGYCIVAVIQKKWFNNNEY